MRFAVSFVGVHAVGRTRAVYATNTPAGDANGTR